MKKVLALVVGVLALSVAALEMYPVSPRVQITSTPTYKHAQKVVAANTQPAPCGRHYVACRGIHSLAEFGALSKADPVLQNLYGFLGPVHLSVLNQNTLAYDSYRVGNQIYWTKTPRLMRAGEPIITDGNWAILQRCGNLIALTPQQPVEDIPAPADVYPPPFIPEYRVGPPPEVTLSVPVLPVQPNSPVPPRAAVISPPSSYIPPALVAGGPGTSPKTFRGTVFSPTVPPAVPVVSVSEPSTGWFFGFGLFFLFLLKGKEERQ